ncbi:phytoene/squalene synthase family protein [Roseixanthobacter glucoisosaccharinicivorans]|uniref:phytoene/squalene synthase family protein n=1 Tax=Roseixanthobacter glucoisosaccharinicivorans TaxID=3119923 RepID=UPI00372C81CF
MSEVLTASEAAIANGSKSFAAAAKLFDPRTRADAVMLYAWCRHCDDVVDGQELGHGRVAQSESAQARLDGLYEETHRAYRGLPTAHPAFAAFAEVIRRNDIPERYPLDLLEGFRMDVEDRSYETIEDTLSYCYHVAGVVGVMMALIMGAREEQVLHRACDLGLAFQLTNISRDVVEDAGIGRVYLPADWLRAGGVEPGDVALPENRQKVADVVARLLDLAEPYYDSALIGMRALPFRSACAIATARAVYRAIGTKVRAAGPHAWDERRSTSKAEKIGFAASGAVQAALSRLASAEVIRPKTLWTRPA